MRYLLVVLWMLFGAVISVAAQVSIGIGVALPGVSIGINLPAYPELVRIPGYPVYYGPRLDLNFFFYDGLYWVYQGDNWYASSWYNGPWGLVAPEVVPLFILRIPVRYYRRPPVYFHGWQPEAPPRWGEHWGRDWEQHRSGWDKWTRRAAPAPAPLPLYQRQYSGPRYPQAEQQQSLHGQKYHYKPRDTLVRQRYPASSEHRVPAPSQRGGEELQRGVPSQAPPRQSGPADPAQRPSPQPRREKNHERDEERGQDRKR